METQYIVVRYHQLFQGDADLPSAYVAEVEGILKITVKKEDDGLYWAYGVMPGGCAGSGKHIPGAINDFRHRVGLVLEDAIVGSNFQFFKEEVVRFFNEVDAESLAEWERHSVENELIDYSVSVKLRTDLT